MGKFQKKKTVKRVIFVLLVALVTLISLEFVRQKQTSAMLAGHLPSIDKVEFNLRMLRQYNTPSGSLTSNFRDLFAGEYSSPAYSIIKYDLTSALFLVILPLCFMFMILVIIGVSMRTLSLVMAVFAVFTVLPLILL